MRVLVIEDDAAVASTIDLTLRSEGYDVSTMGSGAQGIDAGKESDHDVIMLDLALSDMSGYDVLRELRRCNVRTPVIVLSGNALIDAKVKALSCGADDYMTKPFHKDELIARIHAVLRRSNGHKDAIVTAGLLALNLNAKTASAKGAMLNLSNKEYQILELLSLRKGMLVTKQNMLSHLYGGMDEPQSKIIDVFICKLRKKLALACNGERYIETVRDQGFMLREPELKMAA